MDDDGALRRGVSHCWSVLRTPPPPNTYANDAVRTNQLDLRVLDGAFGDAIGIRLHIAHVADMAFIGVGGAMLLVEGIDYETGQAQRRPMGAGQDGASPTVRAGRGAAVGVVAKGVDVEAAFRVGVVARDVVGDGGGSRLGILLKSDGATNLAVATEDADYIATTVVSQSFSSPQAQVCNQPIKGQPSPSGSSRWEGCSGT